MTNAELIQANNAKLRECIELANNLPDAVGGNTSAKLGTAKLGTMKLV